MFANKKCSLDDIDEKADPKVYRSLVGSLLYLNNSHPDVLQATRLLSSFMQSPSKTHYVATKRC